MILALGIVVLVTLAWWAWGRLPGVLAHLAGKDPSWKPTGFKFTTPRAYDYKRAKAAHLRSRRETATGRAIPRPKSVKRAPATKPAEIIAISERRRG